MVHSSALLATALASGIAIGVERGAPSDLAVALTLAASWAASMLGFLRQYAAVQIAATIVLVAGAGWVLGAQAVERVLHPPLRVLLEQRRGGFAFADARSAALKADRPRSEDPIVIEGRLRGDALVTEDGVVLWIDVDRVDVSGVFEPATAGIAVGVSGGLHSTHLDQWTSGRRVRAPVHLRRPARYLNEGVPDQERALARRGVSLVGTIKSAALIDVVAAGWWWEETAASIRARTREALLRHIRPLNGESAAIATAILIGDRSALSVDVEQRLQEAGTYHVIAISGGNIAILAGLLIGVLRLAGVRGRVASCVAIGALAAYALIAAGGASVLRATLMAVIYLAVRLVDQRTGAIDAISLTAVVLLLAEPLAIADVGFWLTFGATAALVTGLANSRGTKDTKDTKEKERFAVRLLFSVRYCCRGVSVCRVGAGADCNVRLSARHHCRFAPERRRTPGDDGRPDWCDDGRARRLDRMGGRGWVDGAGGERCRRVDHRERAPARLRALAHLASTITSPGGDGLLLQRFDNSGGIVVADVAVGGPAMVGGNDGRAVSLDRHRARGTDSALR